MSQEDKKEDADWKNKNPNKSTADFKMSISVYSLQMLLKILIFSLVLFFTSIFFCQSKSSPYTIPNQTD